MSYDLDLFFEPAIDRKTYLQYFSARKHYTAHGTELSYNNPDTGVYFSLRAQSDSNGESGDKIASAAFNLNYVRPSFFGLEAEIEITALVNHFQPRIFDPQISGMGEGPYSGEGLLRSWNYGNVFAAGALRAMHVKAHTLPSSALQRAWRWNYQRSERDEALQYIPAIRPVKIAGQTALSLVWAHSMPILLPRVDFIFIGREENGVKNVGLAPWAEVIEALRDAAQAHPKWRGIELEGDPVSVEYPGVEPLPELMAWAAALPAFDLSTATALSFNEIVDRELIAPEAETGEP